MAYTEGQACSRCNKIFTQSDDVVVCPKCGAPHHRACWEETGHCQFEDTHGTPEQWSRKKQEKKGTATTKHCPQCGTENPEFAEICSHCGCAMETPDWTARDFEREQKQGPGPGQPRGPFGAGPFPPGYGEYIPFRTQPVDPLGGVPREETVAGVEVTDLAAVVGPNAPYYLPRFYKKDRGGMKFAWNWAAFLLTPYWLLYRKSYLFGSLMTVFTLVQTFIVNYLLYVVVGNSTQAINYYDLVADMMGRADLRLYFWILVGLTALSLLLRLVFGLMGTTLYMNDCIRKVSRLREEQSSSYKTMLPTVGGVSTTLGLLAFVILQFAGMIVVML